MKIRLGYCGVCDTVKIWYRDPRTNVIVFTPQYAEFAIGLSDWTIARHAVCKQCIVTLDDKKVKKVFERIRETWQEQYVGWASEKQFDKLKALKLKTWYNGPKMDKDVEKKLKAVKEKEHEDKLKKKGK